MDQGPAHAIRTSMLAWSFDDEAVARRWLPQLGRVHERLVVPVLERVFTELAGPSVRYQLERLELDLGELSVENLESQLASKLPSALHHALAGALQTARTEKVGPNNTQAARSAVELLNHYLLSGTLPWWAPTKNPQAVVSQAARTLFEQSGIQPLLRDWVSHPRARRRLALSLPDPMLVKILEYLRPQIGVDATLIAWVAATLPRRVRDQVWVRLLATATQADAREPAMAQLATALAGTRPLDEIRSVLSAATAPTSLFKPKQRLLEQLAAGTAHPTHAEEPPASEASFTAVPEPEPSVTPLPGPSPSHRRLCGQCWPRPGLAVPGSLLRADEARGRPPVRRRRRPTARRRLLWVIGTGERTPPEPEVPLCKLLCGMPVEAVFDFGEPATEHELEACAQLLTAVNDHASEIGTRTVGGLRGSFLLREGHLGAQHDMPLLRVEQRTYDLVLDRLPWSYHWVKLPWMAQPLRVDW